MSSVDAMFLHDSGAVLRKWLEVVRSVYYVPPTMACGDQTAFEKKTYPNLTANGGQVSSFKIK